MKAKEPNIHWVEKISVEELVNRVIWESCMETTAHTGWTDRAREGLVKNVQESVKWALQQKGIIKDENKSE